MSEIRMDERALEAEAWLEQAESLWVAAEVLGSKLLELDSPPTDHRVRRLGLVRSYMFIIGAAFENSLKAIAVARGHLTINGGTISFKGLAGSRNHRLPDLASALDLRIPDEEFDLLARSAAYLRWAGRYPAALRIGDSEEDRGEQLLSFTTSDREIAQALLRRLHSLAREELE